MTLKRSGLAAPVDSWARTKADYERWLRDGEAKLLIARDVRTSRPVGYVLYLLTDSGATFDFGSLRGDIHSLVVDEKARGAGIGTRLLEAVRSDLLNRGIDYWSVGVLVDNVDAYGCIAGSTSSPGTNRCWDRPARKRR